MRKTVFAAALSALAASGLALDAARAEENPQAGFSRSEIEGIVREYLLSNPEIMYEVQAALEEKQRREQAANSQKVLAEASDQIFNSPHDGVVGNPEGDVTVVEFFDYNCGFCKRALSDMETLVEKDGNLRFVLKEFPILGPDSQKAHVVSMAFRALMPEKYGEFHTRLLGSSGRATEESAMKIALELGADEAALREEMKNPEIVEAFNTTYELANKLQITGTPSYVVGQEVVFGALGGEVLSEKIETARQ
ncbi:DsbA family protein [Chelativorans alearense]|uniref:DsbA family protein n=1 Tax=Chelativorans alearense TaxID=2681495 RepID=UPI0013D52F15|nr:DsbA family protein [Chelativorans alearense]